VRAGRVEAHAGQPRYDGAMPSPPNWFVALPVDPGAWFERVPEPPRGVRRFHPADLHLTIAFLGPVTEEAALAGWDALSWPLGPVEVSLGPVVALGPPRRWSALSALLGEGRDAVETAMAEARVAVWKAAGARPDDRPPKAHVTLARPTRSAPERARALALDWAERLPAAIGRARLDRVALYGWSDDRANRLFAVHRERSLTLRVEAPPSLR
jgi:2'-5' RNA ligase